MKGHTMSMSHEGWSSFSGINLFKRTSLTKWKMYCCARLRSLLYYAAIFAPCLPVCRPFIHYWGGMRQTQRNKNYEWRGENCWFWHPRNCSCKMYWCTVYPANFSRSKCVTINSSWQKSMSGWEVRCTWMSAVSAWSHACRIGFSVRSVSWEQSFIWTFEMN